MNNIPDRSSSEQLKNQNSLTAKVAKFMRKGRQGFALRSSRKLCALCG